MTQTTGAALVFIHALAVTQLAAAQTSPTPETAFDPTVEHALQAYDAEHWDEARRLFEQAHAMQPTARTLRAIGMVAFNQADYVTALLRLEAALVDPSKPLSPEQRSHAARLIELAEQRVGLFRLRLEPAAASVAVDGEPAQRSLDERLVLAPGHHQLAATAARHRMLTHRFDVSAGDRASLELELEPDPLTSAVQPSTTSSPRPEAGRRSKHAETVPDGSRNTWAVIALSTAAASLITAGITAGLAFDAKADLDDACQDHRCPRSERDAIDRYDTLRTVTTVTLVSALAGAAIGTYLLLGDSGAERGAGVRAVISGRGIELQGRL
jgi:hypothetical protein